MQPIKLVWLLSLVALVAGCASQPRERCELPPDLKMAYENADKVFIGRINQPFETETTYEDYAGAPGASWSRTTLTLDVKRSFKGENAQQEEITLRTTENEHTNQVYNLKPYTEYLIFAKHRENKIFIDESDYEYLEKDFQYLKSVSQQSNTIKLLTNCQ